jgi:C_GCAxxG_C_C family probable redox protein
MGVFFDRKRKGKRMREEVTRRGFLKALASGVTLLALEGLPDGGPLSEAGEAEKRPSGPEAREERPRADAEIATTQGKETENLSEREERVQQIYDSGFNCAESVLKACQELYQLPGAEVVPRVATGFGGGIGRKGSVCGALTGGIMALGLEMGRMDPKDAQARDRLYGIAREIYEKFEKEFGTVLCFNLTQCDLSTPEGQKKAKELNLHKNLCSQFVQGMVKWVGEVVEEQA